MKTKNILPIVLCLSFILSSLIGILFVKDVKADSQDIDYTFNQDYFLQDFSYDNFTETIFSSDKFNNRNLTTYTQNYNATYSFENDINKVGLEVPFIDYYMTSGNSYAKVITEIKGHNEILNAYSYSPYIVSFYNDFNTNRLNGTIEFWIRLNNSEQCFFALKEYNFQRGSFYFYSDNKLYVRNVSDYIEIFTYNINVWYHIRIDFNCTSDSYNIYINNILKANNFLFENDASYIDRFHIQLTPSNPFHCYFDAIGYSWDNNYTIGQNLIPYLEIDTSIKEVDKYEFAYESWDNLYDIDSDIFSNWSEIDATYDYVNIADDPNQLDRRIQIENDAINSQDSGIEKEFYINSGILNITWSVNFTDMPSIPAKFCTKVYSSDDTLISNIYIQNGFLRYSANGITQLDDGLTTNVIYEFNLYINYWDNISILYYFADDVYQDSFFIRIPENNKDGLGKIEIFYDCTVEDLWYIYIDYVGVYINGSSISEEFAYVRSESFWIDPYYEYTWNLNDYSQFSVFITNTNCSFHGSSGTFIHGLGYSAQLTPIDLYNGYNIFNVYNITPTNFGYPTLWIQYFNQFNTLNLNIEIGGIRLKEGINSYPIIFSYQNVDIQENFFYVKNNRLYFTHNANENNTLEYIQAKFEIDDTYAINRSINFKTYFLGISKAYFSNNYVSEVNSTFPFRLGHNSINSILPQQQIIKSFTILITDNDNNNYYGNSEGYITSLTLIYYPDIEIIILTLSLIEIMIPLVVLIIPTVAIASVYGKKSVIPMLILMTFICLIGNLIEMEMFFIMLLCLGSGLFLQYKREKDKI